MERRGIARLGRPRRAHPLAGFMRTVDGAISPTCFASSFAYKKRWQSSSIANSSRFTLRTRRQSSLLFCRAYRLTSALPLGSSLHFAAASRSSVKKWDWLRTDGRTDVFPAFSESSEVTVPIFSQPLPEVVKLAPDFFSPTSSSVRE